MGTGSTGVGFSSAWLGRGRGLFLAMDGGILRSFPLHTLLDGSSGKAALAASSFNFVQISDSHVGFSKDANKDVLGTLQSAVDQINAANGAPDLLLHTGDLSHLSKADEFDALDQILKGVKTSSQFFVPGEHDVLEDNGKLFMDRYSKQSKGKGWYSMDHKGVHFIALVNVMNLKAGGLGNLGEEQLAWLAADVKRLSRSTPIVVFAHVPLWTVYPEWGWGTEDGARALSLLKDFGSVTVLNGHIHQTLQKVEGNITFHTAMSTAFPQPKPGSAPSPGPMKVPADQLRSLLGITSVSYLVGNHSLAVVDSTLATPTEQMAVSIDNFTFSPKTVTGGGWNDHPVDEQRRHSAYGRGHEGPVQVEGARHRRQVDVHLYGGGHLRLLLFGSSSHDGNGHCPLVVLRASRRNRMEPSGARILWHGIAKLGSIHDGSCLHVDAGYNSWQDGCCGTNQDAEDAVQNAAVRAFQAVDTFRGSDGTVVVPVDRPGNSSLNLMRTKQPVVGWDDAVDDEVPDFTTPNPEEVLMHEFEVRGGPAGCRSVASESKRDDHSA